MWRTFLILIAICIVGGCASSSRSSSSYNPEANWLLRDRASLVRWQQGHL